jgi:hypothetical protein
VATAAAGAAVRLFRGFLKEIAEALALLGCTIADRALDRATDADLVLGDDDVAAIQVFTGSFSKTQATRLSSS